MTTEDDFQAALDANPADHVTRLVFADWLQERGDPRAEGYRALGMLWKKPQRGVRRNELWGYTWVDVVSYSRYVDIARVLPEDWFRDAFSTQVSDDKNTRREAEDAAALAFAKLPAGRRGELLTPPSQRDTGEPD